MDYAHLTTKRKWSESGQAIVTTIIVTSLLTTSVEWFANRVFNSPMQLSTSISAVEARVGQIETGNTFRDQNYQKLEGDVEYIRRSIEEQNRRQGIVIDTSKK